MAGNLAKYIVGQEVELISNELDYLAEKKFPRKGWYVRPGFSLLVTVKCEIKEINLEFFLSIQ